MKNLPGFLQLGLAALALFPGWAASGGQTTSTVYIGQHFEIRDHHQPIKYVFNGQTRIARITSSLSPNTRIQRLALYTGWNLCSLAVVQCDQGRSSRRMRQAMLSEGIWPQ